MGRIAGLVGIGVFVALSHGAFAHRAPNARGAAAADSRWIGFQRFDPGMKKVRVYEVRPDGTGLRAITKPPANADEDGQPDWSPDGSQVVFHRVYNDGRPDSLIVARADGSAPHDVTEPNCTGDCLSSEQPAWSPDGKKIAFSRAIGPPPADGPPPVVGIFVMDADGSHVEQLTQSVPSSGTEDHTPTWSPNGGQIAFMRANNTKKPENASSIYVMGADGSNVTRIRRMPTRWPGSGVPKWSPDGQSILFDTYCLFGACGQSQTGTQLYTIKANGTGLRKLTNLRGNSYDGSWSPSGRSIVFSRNSKVCCPPSGELYVMRRDGTHVRRLTHAPGRDNHNPDWGPLHR
jgi:Tol biopolymer transport system component